MALRGENPTLNQSTSLPVAALLYRLFPKPVNELDQLSQKWLLPK